ncbi:MAG TPA: C4-type zinc ribbon domain-containing protein [Anaerolineales bacterium]|nr:C4-type zinc ribbon domain-containing protein [Anaerolineales bacterium]
MSAALGLYRLQQVDSQMDQIRARLDAIRETLENDAKLRAAMDAASVSEAEHKKSNNAVKTSEAEVESQRIKIEHAEASLYGGQVTNPKELQDLQMDVASLKKYLVTLEERELEAMVRAEETQKKLDDANKKLQQVQDSWKDQNRDLTAESESLNKDLERLKPERNAVVENIDEIFLKTYKQLRQKKNGVAVASFEENSCSACGTTFTQSQQQSARSADQLFNCPTCGRIIYAS